MAEAVPRLYDVLPWLRDMSVEALITERYTSALFSDSQTLQTKTSPSRLQSSGSQSRRRP